MRISRPLALDLKPVAAPHDQCAPAIIPDVWPIVAVGRLADPLSAFHPVVAEWFRKSLGEPTAVQAAAWPVIAAGRHALITAPTGSGKTLTAFFWALDRLLTGSWPGGGVRVLYVSPLKALNNDIQRNLLGSAEGARARPSWRRRRKPVRDVRVMTRSGDTSAAERRRMLKQPPEILITTPESLNILLTSQGGRSILGGVARPSSWTRSMLWLPTSGEPI